MKIREIHAYPDLVLYPPTVTRPFRDRSRSLCNYLERQLRGSPFVTKGFSRVCVVGTSKPKDSPIVNSAGALVAEVPFDLANYQSATGNRWNELLIEILTAGFAKADDLLPISDLQAGIGAFRGAGYVNEWVHKERKFRAEALKAELHCALTTESFVLRLRLHKENHLILDQKIQETIPDETVFQRELNDVKIIEDEIRVFDKAGKVLWGKPVAALG